MAASPNYLHHGTYMYKPCEVPGSSPLCMPCDEGTSYMDKQNNDTMCKKCSLCDPESEVEERECDFENNRECVCREGFYRRGNKCVMEGSKGGDTNFTFPKPPSSWSWALIVIGLFLFTIIILCVAIRRLSQQGRFCFRYFHNQPSHTNSALQNNGRPNRFPQLHEGLNVLGKVFERRGSTARRRDQGALIPLMRISMEPSIFRDQYGQTLRLDQNTANPWIRITQDQRKAVLTASKQPYPEHPDRFDVYQQALSIESFTFGRHYWEVDVSLSRWCRIGVALNSMERKGGGKGSMLGANPESWCIQKCKDQYKAMHNEQQTCLTVSGNFERLGFLLDCETGCLRCFGDSQPLHVFRGNFTDLVKPALWILGTGGSVQFYL
uniref:erythroid membrane-associated protein-like isoform X2 n=1 Tax=Myxine glutinosa TaxID=7769 RepID=UPI00358E0A85